MKFPVTGRNFLLQEEISFKERNFLLVKIVRRSLPDLVAWMVDNCIFFVSGVFKYYIRLFSHVYPMLSKPQPNLNTASTQWLGLTTK